jgi:hypothetical protein
VSNHGQVVNGWLVKKGAQVQKFWKFDAYGIAQKDLKDTKGVVLHTTYDGVLWATTKEIITRGKPYKYEGNPQGDSRGEAQLILSTDKWHRKEQ